MVSIARKNLFHEKTRFGIGVGGVASGVLLVVVTLGIYHAMDVKVTNLVMNTGADLWVSAEGATGSMHARSILPLNVAENISQIEGVEKVKPLIRVPLSIKMNSSRYLLFLQGYDVKSGMGGPWKVVDGASNPQRGEIIIDRVFARKNDLKIRDSLKILGQEFKIAGISDETSMFIGYLVFLPIEDALAAMPGNTVSYFLVTTDGSIPVKQVVAAINENVTGVSALTSEEVAFLAKGEVLGGFLPIMFVIVVVGLLVGVTMVGLTIYTLTVERTREYGVLKAIGAKNRYLYIIVATQALILSVIGFILGGILTSVVIFLVGILVPEFVILVTIPILVGVFFLFALMGLIASLLPARKVAEVDPATVFKA